MTTYEFVYLDTDAEDNRRKLELEGTDLQRDTQGGVTVIKSAQGGIRAAAPLKDFIHFREVGGGESGGDKDASLNLGGRSIEFTDRRHTTND